MPVLPLAVASLLSAPLLGVTLFLASGAADPPVAADCLLTTSGLTGRPDPRTARTGTPASGEREAESDAGTVALSARQVTNARAVISAGQALRLPQQAAAVALTAAWEHSALLALPSPVGPAVASQPDGAAGGSGDGLFDQQPGPTGGTAAQLADPAHAAEVFLRRLELLPRWQDQPSAEAARAVQGRPSASAYEPYVPVASALAAALWQPGSTALACGPTGTSVGGPGGAFSPQACSVRPDPTTGRGCLTPRTASLAAQLLAQGWQLTCWDPHLWNPSSDHPLGRACDAIVGPPGRYPSPAEKARGDALAAALQASASQTGLSYLIWSGRIWSVARVDEGWRPYRGGGVYDAASPTGGHYDHVHVSVR